MAGPGASCSGASQPAAQAAAAAEVIDVTESHRIHVFRDRITALITAIGGEESKYLVVHGEMDGHQQKFHR